MKICPKCTKEIGDHVLFCPYCGANTQENAAPPQAPQTPPVVQGGFVPPQPPQPQQVPPQAPAPQPQQAPPQTPTPQPQQVPPQAPAPQPQPPQPQQAPPQAPAPQPQPPQPQQMPPQAPPQQGFVPPQPQANNIPPQKNGFANGMPQGNMPPQQNFVSPQPQFGAAPVEQKASVGLAILSFFIPLAGLIIFLTKKNDRPKTAKACGIAAIISVAIGVVFSIIGSVISGVVAKKAGGDFNNYGIEETTEFDWGSFGDDTTKDEEETTKSTADMKPEDYCGKIDDNTYTNEYFGMKYSLGSDYTFSSYDDISSSSSSEIEDGNSVPSMSEGDSTIFYDSMAVSSTDGSSVMTMIYPDGSALSISSEEKVLEYMTKGIKSAYGDSTVGDTYTEFVGGNIVTAVDIEYNVSDYKYYATYIAYKKGDAFFIAQVMSTDKETVKANLDSFAGV